ncbi:MAG: hypothetical protein ACR2GC_03015 [Methyloceanibacter sp.]|uniref:hypothetical protein n=1 Tax=Methyloceanibacter sp. TaxID=1965321 RepID=UPI003D9B3A50
MRSLVIVAFVSLAVTTPSVGNAAEEESATGAREDVQGQILDPAAHNLVRLEPLILGSENDSAHMAPREYRLKVGQGYRWKIVASDQSEYAFGAGVHPKHLDPQGRSWRGRDKSSDPRRDRV